MEELSSKLTIAIIAVFESQLRTSSGPRSKGGFLLWKRARIEEAHRLKTKDLEDMSVTCCVDDVDRAEEYINVAVLRSSDQV